MGSCELAAAIFLFLDIDYHFQSGKMVCIVMKFILNLLLGIALPAFAASNLSSDVNLNSQNSSGAGSRPYVVEIVSAKGEKTSEVKGISDKGDPFLISEQIGASPYKEDKFSVFPSIGMGIGGKITLYRAPDYKVKDGKKEFIVRSWTKTVGDLLDENKIALGQDDKINFSPSTPLELNMNININRVAKTILIQPEDIAFKTTKKSNPNVEKGTKKVLQAGKKGTKNKYYLVTREDGVEISRVFQKSEVMIEPTEEIDEVGTKVVTYGSGVASIWKSDSGMVAACNFVSRGTKIHLVNTDNGKSVDVTCMGGGLRSDRLVDLSDTAFEKLGGTWSQGLLNNIRAEKYYSE